MAIKSQKFHNYTLDLISTLRFITMNAPKNGSAIVPRSNTGKRSPHKNLGLYLHSLFDRVKTTITSRLFYVIWLVFSRSSNFSSILLFR